MKNNLTNNLILSGIMVCLMIFLDANSLFAASAVLSWDSSTTSADGSQLNDLAGYKVYYGTESGNYSGSIDVGNVVTYQVNNLSPGATYYFVATAYDTTGNESQYSAEINKTFPGSDTAYPVISGVQASGITDSSVTVSWTTDEASDTKVQYGTTSFYGTTTALDSSMVTSHSQSISGLAASTLYHYRVISSDAAGNEKVTDDFTFTTAALPEPVDYYCDSDNDGYAGTSIDGSCISAGCEPAGCQITPGSDCNDSNALINPGADDSGCNGIDEDCDGVADDDYVSQTVQCGEGECASTGLLICDNGQIEDNCTAKAPPEETEATCDDGLDNDCDGSTDSVDADCYIPDADGDGYAEDIDCDDNDAAVNPGATDVCGNGIDEDCSGADEACSMSDNDGDGYTEDVDCDDSEAVINPGAVEDCTDGVDNDCDGLIDMADPSALNCPLECEDFDMDGYSVDGGDCGPAECDDSNPYINPGAVEICDDGIDNDCDGLTDCGEDPDCDTASVCDSICYPEKEICDDEIDNDCDGTIDCDDFSCRRSSFCSSIYLR